MTSLSIEVGDICKVVPHFPDWENVGAVPIGGDDEIIWVPRGSLVLVADVLQSNRDDAGWCHVMFGGRMVEMGADLLELFRGA